MLIFEFCVFYNSATDEELHIDADDAVEYFRHVLGVTDEDLEGAAEAADITEEDLEEAAEEVASALEKAGISEGDLEEAAEGVDFSEEDLEEAAEEVASELENADVEAAMEELGINKDDVEAVVQEAKLLSEE